MKYRAKITAIPSWISEHYNPSVNPIIKDDNDMYIEVDSDEEAESIEFINKMQQNVNNLKGVHQLQFDV